MLIEDKLPTIVNIMFKQRHLWKWVTDEQKTKYFFIINRLLSKKYPEEAQLLNNKNIDIVTAADLWFYFNKDKIYPQWIWSKSPTENNTKISKQDAELLLKKINLDKIEDLEYLILRFPDLIEEELKFYKTKQK